MVALPFISTEEIKAVRSESTVDKLNSVSLIFEAGGEISHFKFLEG